jgi:hypothetical protein
MIKAHMAIQKNFETPHAEGSQWSQQVTETSDSLDLQAGVFALTDPREIALSLKKSADTSAFYINRAGRHLSEEQRDRLEEAKDELRELYGRPRQNPGEAKSKDE